MEHLCLLWIQCGTQWHMLFILTRGKQNSNAYTCMFCFLVSAFFFFKSRLFIAWSCCIISELHFVLFLGLSLHFSLFFCPLRMPLSSARLRALMPWCLCLFPSLQSALPCCFPVEGDAEFH